MNFDNGATVTLVRRTVTGTDAYGNDVLGETTVDVDGAVFAPGGSTELTGGRDTVITQPTVYLPATTDTADLGALAAVEVGGVRYEVDGTPRVWASPFTGWAPGIEVRLKGASG